MELQWTKNSLSRHEPAIRRISMKSEPSFRYSATNLPQVGSRVALRDSLTPR